MKTIICAQFKQESNRYAKGVSGVKEYTEREYVFGEEGVRALLQSTKSEMGGFMDVLDGETACRLVPVMALNASPGPVTAQAVWEQACETLLAAVEGEPQVDGVLLALHGAMVTERMEDGEGELLERLRTKVGGAVPVIATLDLHANITEKMMKNATALFPCDYYPHTDFYESGVRAANCMWQTVMGEMAPKMRWHKMDLIFPFVNTGSGPIVPILQKAQVLRETGTLINLGICHGFFLSDIYEQGAAVLAITDGDADLAQQQADALAAEIWDSRHALQRQFYTAKEAVALAMKAEKGPIVLADVADNPGSGATTDGVALLRELIEAGATDTAFAVIYDPAVAALAHHAGVGATIEVALGGKLQPEITGGPLHCTATVIKLTDGQFRNRGPMNTGVTMTFGDSAVLRIAGVLVIVCSNHAQPYDLEIYRYHGIDPESMKILAVKSAVHYRADFSTVAKEILDVETPALGCMRSQAVPLTHSRRPIYPLD